ncbi:MAG: DUF4838 domain-containing protein [Saccharofermentanales bacterium]
MKIIEEHRSYFKIVISSSASIPVCYAASELQHFITEMTEVVLPIIDDLTEPQSFEIHIGFSNRTTNLMIMPDPTLGKEGYIIKVLNGNLIIAGGEPRGTLYGVYSFLENFCGCRWFSSNCSIIPVHKTINIDDNLDVRFKPVFEYRETYYFDSFDSDFAVRNRLNGNFMRLSDEHGGKVKYAEGYFVHSCSLVVPLEKFYDSHPEYFALRNGKHDPANNQLCLTNPDVLKITIEKVLEDLRKEPDAKIISISQNDGGQPCACPECRAIAAEEESEAAPILRFVNQVAEAVEKEFADIAIDTLAYGYSRKPPKFTKPRANVIIRLCSFECCFVHQMTDCRNVSDFVGDIENWARISERLYIWDYVTNFEFYQLMHPNFQVLSPNIKFYAANNVKGVFAQGNGQGPNGEMAELRTYLLAKLLWDPDYDIEVGTNEFLSAWFGPASDAISEYIDLVRETILASSYHLRLNNSPTASYITPELLEKADILFDKAEELTFNLPMEKRRVLKERMAIKFAWFFNTPPDIDRASKVDDFMDEAKNLDIKFLSERWNFEDIRRLLLRGTPPTDDEKIVNIIGKP